MYTEHCSSPLAGSMSRSPPRQPWPCSELRDREDDHGRSSRRSRRRRKPEQLPFLLAALNLLALFHHRVLVTSAAPVPVDPKVCGQLTFNLFSDCKGLTAHNVTSNATLTDDCCQRAKEANSASCYCDLSLLDVSKVIGLTAAGFVASLLAKCEVPMVDINVLNITGCGSTIGAPPPPMLTMGSLDCQKFALSLLKNCSRSISPPVSNLTKDGECCEVMRQSNEASCFCDAIFLRAIQLVGVTQQSIEESLNNFCDVPTQNIKLRNVTNCGTETGQPLGSPSASARRGMLMSGVLVAVPVLVTFLLA